MEIDSDEVVLAKRVIAVRKFCIEQLRFDHDINRRSGGLTDRAWCAQSILNILDGLIDNQL